jgi:hypothetical protein
VNDAIPIALEGTAVTVLVLRVTPPAGLARTLRMGREIRLDLYVG